MSSWRMKMNKCSSSGVQTLDSLRQRLRTEALLCDEQEACDGREPRDDLFPEGVGEECLESDGARAADEGMSSDDICQMQMPQEELPPPRSPSPCPPAKQAPKRRSKKTDGAGGGKTPKNKAVDKLCESEDRPDDPTSGKSSDTEPDEAAGGAGCGPCSPDMPDEMGESDLAAAFAAIMADFKDITQRVKALSSVMTDVQAAGVRRSFAGLGKALNEAAAIACGGSKAPAAPRKKKAVAGKK
ncbi:putative late transcription factor VLTF-4 [Parapoxvirus red deer/HL953]|uniref:Putative late transcription factor VLTF-4 n=1 Tax=Parapoxvirus red deer/HL953 TaxID=1579460 RepID=A0A0A7MC45_9POXV|nr:putative late transcription factor VLTF-4 [Parapoxvirus red deer/HL953]AIZ77312.1 putative late transcription factor VLTF-4 [Parapoxvirus red deer/HL953]